MRNINTADVPSITVATVVLNCADKLRRTIQSVINQDYPRLEYIVVDGGSTDGTVDVIREYSGAISRWISEKDKGLYFAMNKAVDMATGDYLLFMNADDIFIRHDSLSRLMQGAPADADFIYGHYIFATDNCHHLMGVDDFEDTWRELISGEKLRERWVYGVPGHQSTLTRTSLLKRDRYDTSLRIAADHEFMFRQRKNGARFHRSNTIVSVFAAGGVSQKKPELTITEARLVASAYGNKEVVNAYYEPMLKYLESERKQKKYRRVPKWMQRCVRLPWWLITGQLPAKIQEYLAARQELKVQTPIQS